MRDTPKDPLAFAAQVNAALCADIFDIGRGTFSSFERLDALRDGLPPPYEPSDAEVNALLHAAAPELLEALTAMLDAVPNGASRSAAEAAADDLARAAIRKAKGEA